MAPIIKIDKLSKQYRLGQVGTGTIRSDFQRWWAKVRGQEDPSLMIGAENRLDTVDGEYVWALKDINLEVEQGEVLGIIGKNGAGKSTLLKILSRVTTPTTGSIKVKGKVASLLEVGTGFNPELTGRENIFLNGAILGMTKAEINSKFDEIVDFSGVEKYIDTPVKRYSSGMYVRLGFAVAAHLDPEILIVDEVLAVGDAEFQKKAIGKMQDVSRNDGRTVLFVSHNMGAMKKLCPKGVLLINGKIDTYNNINIVVDKYLSRDVISNQFKWTRKENGLSEIFFNYIEILNKNNVATDTIGTGEDFKIGIIIESKIKSANTIIAIQINDVNGYPVFTTSNSDYNNRIEKIEIGITEYSIIISKNILMPGNYYLIIACFESGRKLYDVVENEISLKIEDLGLKLYNKDSNGVVFQKYKWIIK